MPPLSTPFPKSKDWAGFNTTAGAMLNKLGGIAYMLDDEYVTERRKKLRKECVVVIDLEHLFVWEQGEGRSWGVYIHRSMEGPR